jgi:integrase
VKNTQYIFYGDRNPFHPISSGTIRDVCLNIGYKGVITPHGFRSSFSTWANELCESNQALWSSDAIEAFLNHTPRNKVRRAYNRYQYIEPRRILAQTWADQVYKWMND